MRRGSGDGKTFLNSTQSDSNVTSPLKQHRSISGVPPKTTGQPARPKTSIPNSRQKTELMNGEVSSVEIQSLQDIIAALNQKLKRTDDLEHELNELRNGLQQSNDSRQ